MSGPVRLGRPPLSSALASPVLASLLALSAPALAQDPPSPAAPPAPIDVRVEGDRGAPPRATRDPDVASYVARGDDLKRPGASATEVLAASPGVESSRTGAGSDLATISIRGAPSAELPVYLAGVRLNDDVTGAADLSTVPLFALDRVEVYRGNAPAGADRLGIGGAIFFEPRLPRGTRAGASLGAGSFGELSVSAFGSVGDDRAGALLSFSRQSADNAFTYLDDRFTQSPSDDRLVTRRNGDATTYDAWAIGRAALPRGGRLVLIASAFAREQGVVGTSISPARLARSATQRDLAAASVRLPCAAEGADRCSIELTSSAILSRRTIVDPRLELGFLSSLVQTSGQRWGESARLRARITDRVEAGASVFAGIDRLGVDLSSGPVTRASRLSITASADVRWSVTDRLTLLALGAGECHTPLGVAEAGACALGGPAGRAGVRVAAPLGVELVALGGSYVRAPTLGELYGLSATVLGNDELAPERGFTAEITLRRGLASAGGGARGHAEVTGFARLVDDLILYRFTSRSTIKPFNVSSARVLGVEALAGADVARHVRAEASLTLLDPRDTTPLRRPASDLLPYHAPVSAAALLEVYADPSRSVPFMDRAAAALRLRYRAPRFADDAARVRLAEIWSIDLDVTASLLRGRLAARLSATNLLDVANRDLLGFALPGRALHATVEGAW